jgi:hypothetical protein
MSFALLATACSIIFPIILSEGPAAVFLPLLGRQAPFKAATAYNQRPGSSAPRRSESFARDMDAAMKKSKSKDI